MIIEPKNKRYILDGALGTMFQKRGMKPGEDSTAFALKNPEIVKEIEREYIEAGADIILAPTFNLSREKVKELGYDLRSLIKALCEPAIELREEYARRGREVAVSLDIGPQGVLIEPLGELSFEDACDFYAELVREGVNCGVDSISIETMTDIYDVKAAVLAAKENSDLPVFVTMSFEENGRTFTGTSIETMAVTLEGMGVDAIGINCSLGPVQILPLIKELISHTNLPVAAKPNAGLPDPATGEYDISCEEFVSVMKEYMKAGVALIGGCCGTTPEYIEGLARAAEEIEYVAPERDKIFSTRVSGRSNACSIDHVAVIGERLNPTGKKKLKNALVSGDYDYILLQATSQVDAGAEILDVNVGVPGIDEVTTMRNLVKKLQSVVDVPLQIDSSNHEAIEAALRVVNGKAIVNSVNGEDAVLDRVLPIVKKYGAAVIGLTLDDRGIPETCEQRFEIAKKILSRALKIGIPKENVIIDCLTLTASAQQKEVDETLKTVRMVRDELGLRTALGVSNISFGLPMRGIINRTFLTMAMENGLDLPIINPNDEDMMASIMAFNVLKNKDGGAALYIDKYSSVEKAMKEEKAAEKTYKDRAGKDGAPGCSDAGASQGIAPGSDVLRGVAFAVDRGLEAETASEVMKLLEIKDPMAVVTEDLIPALDRVGKGFESGEIFLPSMIKSAEAAQAGFAVIKEKLAQAGMAGESRGDVVIATVKGDIHDIGKNIVRVIMENYGFNMIDLGRDVAPEKVLEAVVKNNVRLVGLSALMTTTLSGMAETVALIKREVPDCQIMVGGAVLTADYAKEMGADYYCEDAMKSVEAAEEVFG